jgi:hypothetical protein
MSEQTLPPFAQTLQIMFGGWVSSAVCALARLGVADHLDETPRSTEELAPKIGAKPDLLYRLLRATSSVGIVSETADKRFTQTPMSAALRSDAVPCLRNVALFNTDEWHVRGWGLLADTIRTGQRPVERLYGMPIFEYLGKHHNEAKAFNDGMTDMSTIDGPAVAQA